MFGFRWDRFNLNCRALISKKHPCWIAETNNCQRGVNWASLELNKSAGWTNHPTSIVKLPNRTIGPKQNINGRGITKNVLKLRNVHSNDINLNIGWTE
jgi:hypothetical protein